MAVAQAVNRKKIGIKKNSLPAKETENIRGFEVHS